MGSVQRGSRVWTIHRTNLGLAPPPALSSIEASLAEVFRGHQGIAIDYIQ